MDFRLLGWASIILAVIATSPWWLRKLNSLTFKTKDKRFLNLLKILRPIHKVAGILLALIAAYHGYLGLNGQIKWHTGSLLYLSFFLTAVLGVINYFKKDKRVFKGHKAMSLISMLLFLLHLLEPWALGKWFGIW